jgi:hypothetical protein
MLVVNKVAARKASAGALLTLQHALGLLDTLFMRDASPEDGYVGTVVGLMQEHASVVKVQLSGVGFLKQCVPIVGMDAAITGAGGVEALVECVRRHADGRLQTGALHTLGLLLNAATFEAREERVERALAAGCVQVLLKVLGDVPAGVARLPGSVQNALVVLYKLCASDARYQALVQAGGVRAIAGTVSRFRAECDVVACLGVLHRIYCRTSGLCGGLSRGDVEGVVAVQEAHPLNTRIQQSACGILGMYLLCLREGTAAGGREGAGAEAEWCVRAVLGSMQRHAGHAWVLDAGFKALVAFVTLKHSFDQCVSGAGQTPVCTGGGCRRSMALLHAGGGREGEVAKGGVVYHSLESLWSGCILPDETHTALVLLASVAAGNAEAAGAIVEAGGIRAVLGGMAKGTAENGRALRTDRHCSPAHTAQGRYRRAGEAVCGVK